MTSPNERQEALSDELLNDYFNSKAVLGDHGLTKQLTMHLVERALEA